MSVDACRVVHMANPTVLLDFERAHPRHTPTKEERIIHQLALRPARYYVLLARAASSREGLEHDAVTAHRVLRLAHILPTL
jgi:hypothetical protein